MSFSSQQFLDRLTARIRAFVACIADGHHEAADAPFTFFFMFRD
jgi:hypothetical protein